MALSFALRSLAYPKIWIVETIGDTVRLRHDPPRRSRDFRRYARLHPALWRSKTKVVHREELDQEPQDSVSGPFLLCLKRTRPRCLPELILITSPLLSCGSLLDEATSYVFYVISRGDPQSRRPMLSLLSKCLAHVKTDLLTLSLNA